MRRFRLGGLAIASELDLPVLPRLEAADVPPDVTARMGPVPETLDEATRRSILMEARGEALLLIRVPQVARFLVRDGREIVADPAPGVSGVDLVAHLLGIVQTALWHQRGLLPLHAAVVTIGGRALAVAGPSTSGKSTLAAALAARGHSVLADDACVVDLDHGSVTVLPTVGMTRLWPDSARALGYDPESLPRALGVRRKYLVGEPVSPSATAVPLAATLLLGTDNRQAEGGRLERVRGSAAVLALAGVIQRPRMARLLGVHARCFKAAATLAATTEVARLWRPRMLGELDGLATLAESVLADR